jgi:predicted NAD/FAD-binding protein
VSSFCAASTNFLTCIRWTHYLLTALDANPRWLTLKYGARSYIDAVMKGFPSNHIFLNTIVQSITNDDDGHVLLHLENGESKVYDHVIVATHGDQAYALILAQSEYEQRRILSDFQTSRSTAVLHSDLTLMPKSRKAWSSCNYVAKSATIPSDLDQACVTYNMNILQHIPEETFGPVLVTLNPVHSPNPALVQGRYKYSHPVYHSSTIRSQRLLPRIQNTRGISYCGAWTRYGFHEDGFTSGLKVAQDHLGAKLPFQLQESTFNRGQRPILGLVGLFVKLGIVILQIIITIVERLFVAQRARRQQLEWQAKKYL